MGQAICLQFEDDKPLHLVIVEDKIDEEFRRVGNDMLLGLHKGKTTAKFQNEFVEVINKSLFKFSF